MGNAVGPTSIEGSVLSSKKGKGKHRAYSSQFATIASPLRGTRVPYGITQY